MEKGGSERWRRLTSRERMLMKGEERDRKERAAAAQKEKRGEFIMSALPVIMGQWQQR